MKEYQLFIDGEYRPAQSGKLDQDMNPATGECYANVHQAGLEDVEAALSSSARAFESWKNMGPSAREALLLKAADIMEARADELRDVLIDEGGSTLLKAGYEIHHTPGFIRSMAGECRRVKGETYLSDYPGVISYCIRRPLGVVLAISPFNFPLLLSTRKIGWALAAGNCVILKPSEVTPVIGLKLGEIFAEAGLPEGVLNVIPGDGAEIGDTLVADPRVKFVTFTGSTAVGKHVGQTAAKHMTKCALELGGKNPVIVLNDADIDYAVDCAAFSNFMHQGQVCMTGSRVIVEAGVYDEFCEKFAAKVSAIKAGDPREPGTIVGPLIRPTQSAYIQEQVDAAKADGARVLCGGSHAGSLYQPTVVADVTQKMSLFRTECFGPCAAVIKADDYRHAIAIANDCEYGLSSAVITNDLEKAIEVSESIESGMCHINGPSIRDEPVVPFGGVKNSGMGREGGHFSMEELTELKWITIQIGKNKFPF